MKKLVALLALLPSIALSQQLCPLGSYNFNGQCLNNTSGVAIIGGQTGTGTSGKGGGITLQAGSPTAPSTATGDVILFSDPSNPAVNFKCAQPTAGNTGTATCTASNLTVTGGSVGTVSSVGLTMPSGFTVTGSPVTSSGTLAVTTALSGVLKGTGSAFAAAASSDVIALWTGTCNNTTFMRADGTCATAGGSVPVPGTTPDLVFWYESDDVLTTQTGTTVPLLRNRTPWLPANGVPTAAGNGPLTTATTLNSLPLVSCAAAATCRMGWTAANFAGGVVLTNSTIFVVFQPATVSAVQAFFGGTSGSYSLRVNASAKLEAARTNNSTGTVIGASTTSVVLNTAFQGNVTYNSSTGVLAFRIARAAAGTATNAQAISTAVDSFLYDRSAPGADLNGNFGVIMIFNRVLSGAEITAVENYLNTKWGV